MNAENYASLEASQRLLSSGIVLETERYWYIGLDGNWQLSHDYDKFNESITYIPAASFCEVWRELPDFLYYPKTDEFPEEIRSLSVSKHRDLTVCGYGDYANPCEDINPTDALIDLLIWQKGRTP